MLKPMNTGVQRVIYGFEKSRPKSSALINWCRLVFPKITTFKLVGNVNFTDRNSSDLNHIATVFSELVEVLDPIKLINIAKNILVEYQLQRIGYILDHIDVMDEPGTEIIINALAHHVQEHKPSYLPLASEISKIGYSRCKKWRIIENSEIESDL